MQRKNLTLAVIALLCSLHVGTVSAIDVGVIPDPAVLNVGDFLTVDVEISGLGSFSAPSLGAFDIDLQFGNSLFAPGAVTFGDQLDLFGFGSIQDDFTAGGVVNAFEASLDFPSDLDAFQLDTFVLFSVQFEALSAGVGVFDLAIIDLADSIGNSLSATTHSATVQVISPNAVPVPAAVWLFGTALLGLFGFGKRKSRAAA